jgi:hypothetical protein
MAIGTYSELQSAITSFPDRPDLVTADVKNMIQLAEARLNRLLKSVETEAALTGTPGSRTVSLSSLTILEPMALKLVQSSDGDERDVIIKPYGEIDYVDDAGEPDYAEIVGTNLKFICPLDEAYDFRFIYRGRFALSDAAPTNKMLTENPDVYLAASIVWGGIYTQDEASVSLKGILDEFVAEARRGLAQAKRTQSSLPPMISALGRNQAGTYDGTN